MKTKEDNGKIGNPPESPLKNLSKGYVTLPMDEEHFKRFIVGLLGKPQTIEKSIIGNFEIHLKDIQNFHDLISQRIEQQNNGRLIQLRTTIYYSDKSNVELGSYEELATYNQVKPVVSEAIKLSWSYLIQFSDKSVPEKQEIDLLIASTGDRKIIHNIDFPIFISDLGEFRITIRHTARTWGDDIESLLTNQINSIISKESKFKTFIRDHSSKISIVIAVLFVLSSIIGGLVVTSNFCSTEINKVNNFSLKNPSIDEKLNFLTQYIASGTMTKYSFKVTIFFIASIIIGIVLGIWVEDLADTKTPSFLILTRESLKRSEKIKDRLKRKWTWFFISIFISIAAGIAANYIFHLLIS